MFKWVVLDYNFSFSLLKTSYARLYWIPAIQH